MSAESLVSAESSVSPVSAESSVSVVSAESLVSAESSVSVVSAESLVSAHCYVSWFLVFITVLLLLTDRTSKEFTALKV